MSALTWTIILLLIAVNALYVAAEFATVSARRSRIQQRADRGDRLARLLLPVVRDAHALDRYVAACQIGITVSSLVLGAYGQVTLTPALGHVLGRTFGLEALGAQSVAAVIVLVGLTAGQMILGELIPKSLALQFPTQVALWTALPMRWSLRLMSWFIAVLNGSGTALLRLLGMYEASGHRHIHSPEEIELLIAESRDGGLLEPEEHRRLRRALHLASRTVNEIMVPRPRIVALPTDAPGREVVRAIGETPFTRLPVYEGDIDRIVGFVHARDVAVRALERDEAWDARALTRPALFVPEGMTADQLLVRMREERRQLAIVVDEYGGTAGLVTVNDVLDEVMGDVADERGPGTHEPEHLPDGRVRLPGDLRVDEAAPWIVVEWEDEGEAHTVGGRVMELLGRMPRPGDHVRICGVDIEVERVRGHAVDTVLVLAPGRDKAVGSRAEVTRG